MSERRYLGPGKARDYDGHCAQDEMLEEEGDLVYAVKPSAFCIDCDGCGCRSCRWTGWARYRKKKGKRPMNEPITEFRGPYRFLSNFWPASVVFDGIEYPSVEHAYQASKTDDVLLRQQISWLERPGAAKEFSKQLKPSEEWYQHRVLLMEALVWEKFFRHEDLKQKLLDTGAADLVEGNTWGDTFWGVCGGAGHNHLGQILMAVRARLRAADEANP